MYVRRTEIVPIDLGRIATALPARLADRFRRTAEWGGVLAPKTGDAVADAIVGLRPDLGPVLDELRGLPRPGRHLSAATMQTAGHEADAVRLAFDIADFPRRQLRETRPDGATPFVERLADLRVGEDLAVAYDAGRFLDFDRVDHPAGIATFVHRGERLVVLNVNRQPLERTTGADLIYLNECTNSWVLVQYKSLRREPGPPPRTVFRPTGDRQLQAELDRMRALPVADDDGTPGGYRLHPGSCFLKLCQPVASLEHASRTLVSGMYLPLDYYDVLLASEGSKGPRGGIALGYDTVARAISNDLFVGLVRGGWVGSRGAASDSLTELVAAGVAADRSMTVAVSTTDRPDRAPPDDAVSLPDALPLTPPPSPG
jgi:hypothetical protein